jgi:predicted HAD superfamily Cof-like phosphohydrolase
LVINLDKNFYKLVDDLDARIPKAPSLVNCETLTIKGDYKIENGVEFRGNVVLENNSNEQKTIN